MDNIEGADEAQTVNEPQKTKDANRADNPGIDSRQVTKHADRVIFRKC